MQRLMEKLISGRFLLTLIVGIILLRACWVDVANVDKFMEIFMVVIYAYFNRQDRGNK